VLVIELTTADVDVVFFAIITVPDVVLLDARELLVVDAVSWLVEVEVVGVLTRVDELLVVEPVLALELTVASVVGVLKVSLVREVELAAVWLGPAKAPAITSLTEVPFGLMNSGRIRMRIVSAERSLRGFFVSVRSTSVPSFEGAWWTKSPQPRAAGTQAFLDFE
jgi:hypothetical protein